MSYSQPIEYWKTIGTAAISLLVVGTALGIVLWYALR
jgi:hypothetical protein